MGGLGVLQMEGGEVQTRLVFDRGVITAFRGFDGLGAVAKAARDGLAAVRSNTSRVCTSPPSICSTPSSPSS